MAKGIDKDIDTSNKEFQDALSLVQFTRNSIFLTGRAGTGKSTFLRYLCQHTKKKFVVLAPTGIAAINAGGSTLHSFFKLPFHPLLSDDPCLSTKDNKIYETFKYSKQHIKLIRELELIIIDEISMVRADVIDAIDRLLRVYSGNQREPFGGKQMLLVGDTFQLEPVVTADERDILNREYNTPYFFSAKVYRQMTLVAIELQKVYRQKDKTFINILDNIRRNTARQNDLDVLNKRFNAEFEGESKNMYITLATRRYIVDNINEQRLSELKGKSFVLRGIVDGDFPDKSLPTNLELELKKKAQIIFVKNDKEKRWVNGTIGVVKNYDKEKKELKILTDDGTLVDVVPEVWNNVRYTYNEEKKEVEQEVLGSFSQYPIRLAWAITIHKSQGQTFSNAVIDFTGGVFAAGQTYVALSRCTSLGGMILKHPLSLRDIFIRPEVVAFSKTFNDQIAIERAMKQAEADIDYKKCISAFDKGDFSECVDFFFKAIHENYRIEQPLYKRYIKSKLGIINKLRRENDMLRAKLEKEHSILSSYADEYYEMGNQCITEANDLNAALANYNKALNLDPLHIKSLVRKSSTLGKLKRYHEALETIEIAVANRPMDFKAVYNRGKLHLALDNYEEAVRDFDKATSIQPEHHLAHKYFGDALMGLGLEDAAENQWMIAERLSRKKRKE